MQLDKTHLTIRQRGALEVADLALLVGRQYPLALLATLFIGAAPWILLDMLLIGWIPWRASVMEFDSQEVSQEHGRYLWLLGGLIFLQAPIGGVVMTAWLGRVVFQQRPTLRETLKDVKAVAVRLIVSLGILRGPIPMMLLLLLVWGKDFSPLIEAMWVTLLGLCFLALRFLRPYTPEILILERCPLRKPAGSKLITAWERSGLLHNPASGEVSGRWFIAAFIAVIASGCVSFGVVYLRDMMVNRVDWTLDVLLLLIPISLWLVVGGMTLLRFLNYLDLRIRLEGWEVDLTLRAEAERWQRSDSPIVPNVAERLAPVEVGGLR